jgi:hypothetical protein
MATIVTRRSRGRETQASSQQPLPIATTNPTADSSSQLPTIAAIKSHDKYYSSSRATSSSHVRILSTRARIGLVGGAVLCWLYLDTLSKLERTWETTVPLRGNTSAGSTAKATMSLTVTETTTIGLGQVKREEIIFPRAIHYALGEDLDVTTTDTSVSVDHYRYSAVERLTPRLVQKHILDSNDYRALDEYVETSNTNTNNNNNTADCQLPQDWQLMYHPACNSLHEIDFTAPSLTQRSVVSLPGGGKLQPTLVLKFQIVTHGYYRDVFSLLDEYDTTTHMAFKPMRYKHDYTFRNLDRMRRDALVMAQLTRSKYVVNIYLHCGTSGLFEFGNGGDLEAAIPLARRGKQEKTSGEVPALSQLEKLHIGTLLGRRRRHGCVCVCVTFVVAGKRG